MTVRRLQLDVTGGNGATRLVVNSRRRRIEGISSCERALVGQGGIGFHSGIAVGNDLPRVGHTLFELNVQVTLAQHISITGQTGAINSQLLACDECAVGVGNREGFIGCGVLHRQGIACADQAVRVVDRPAAGQGRVVVRSNRTRGVIDAGR